MDVGQSHVAATVKVRQQPMIEAEQVQDRGMQIVDMDLVLDGGITEVALVDPVGSWTLPLDAASHRGKPGRESAPGYVVADPCRPGRWASVRTRRPAYNQGLIGEVLRRLRVIRSGVLRSAGPSRRSAARDSG